MKFGVKLKKLLLLASAGTLFLVVFIYDVIDWSVAVESDIVQLFRDLSAVAAFFLLYFLITMFWKRNQNLVKKLGFILVLTIVVCTAAGLLSLGVTSEFDSKNFELIPLAFDAIILAHVYTVVLGSMILIIFLHIRDIVLAKPRKGSRRNFWIFLVFALATAASTLLDRPLESGLLTYGLLALTVLAIVMNSFRLSWIVYLSKREKLFGMVYGFLLFCTYIGFLVMTSTNTAIGQSLAYYSPAVKSFITIVGIFGTVYFGMTFISTLFHLPTAEAFDRKISEVASLHNLGRLVTQMFDFNELVDTVTKMTLEVCEASSSWLEIIRDPAKGGGNRGKGVHGMDETAIDTVGLRNITLEDARAIGTANGGTLRSSVLDTRAPIVIDDVMTDRRTKDAAGVYTAFRSLVVVPLVSHDRVIGILYATKEMQYGFDKEDVEVISAFADQATIAVENSRLIEKSLERERLMREMLVAQDMQKRLLPQQIPSIPGVDLEALSTPAFEVGGDYYDFTMLDEHHLGIVIGDVSGKGVSAAFYMAEMKGIFQSLSKIYHSPKEFLTKAHAVLTETIDKRSFISLLYAVVDLRTGVVRLSRAGHCPMVHVTAGKASYVTPRGLGLGMGTNVFFEQTIVEQEIMLRTRDLLVFYTDGVTEAHTKDGIEFGYERLLRVIESAAAATAVEVRDAIIVDVDRHMSHEPPEDDLTIVVLKWNKS